MQTSNEVAIRVLHKQRGTDSVWSLDVLSEKVLTMRDMYERIEEGGSLVVSRWALIRVGWALIRVVAGATAMCEIVPLFLSQDETIGPDPFYDLEQHALLGVANISLECLLHGIEFVYDAPVVAPTGKVGGA